MFGSSKHYKRVICADGFSMSVQASSGAYCEPRIDGAASYSEVEVGYPSVAEPDLMQWVESPDRPTDTVYGWVPSKVVRAVIEKHGGMVDGEVPPGV
tara:strand:+ start:595 stop:885 length:291 start_codon:yes stop_codon:yes gene_type:complete